MGDDDIRPRPYAYEEGKFLWNLQRVPHSLSNGEDHPGRTIAIFVVHGIGEQVWTATAAELRSGFEDAFEDIRNWQAKKKRKEETEEVVPQDDEQRKSLNSNDLPSPFVYEGYWADYPDVQNTFPEDWRSFNKREQGFFSKLWQRRVLSGPATVWWYLKQLVRLIGLKSFVKNPFVWFLCLPLLLLFPLTLLIGLIRYPKLVTGYLADVRLYADPRGDVERAIAQRIDKRVGSRFLELLGLDWDFRSLPSDECIEAGCERMTFKRVVWVAHSLGTVISYNVLSSLFKRAEEIEASGDEEQRKNVNRFRGSLARFVTLGSPLDKIAFLFRDTALMPWQKIQRKSPGGLVRPFLTMGGLLGKRTQNQERKGRRSLLKGGESDDPQASWEEKEWWVNFYSVFDPVSGPLDEQFICGDQPPWNYFVTSWKSFVPGYSHVAYWSDKRVLKFILGRAYGCEYLPHGEYNEPPYPFFRKLLTGAGFVTWAGLLYGALYAIYHWRSQIWQFISKQIGKYLGFS